jgi:hypothetical protein
MKIHPLLAALGGGMLFYLTATSLQAQTFSPGLLKLEVYRDIPGSFVDDLRFDPKYPDFPDEVHYVTRFEIPASKYVAGNSGGILVGQRLSGYLIPTQTANYVFYMSVNENGELWLARNPDEPANIEWIASGTANYPARTYDLATPSVPIQLEAGKRYYIEALMKQGGKEDSMAVAWTKENEAPPAFGATPIGGQFLGILTTPDATPPAAVADLTVDNELKGISYLWLNWSAPADPDNTDAAAQYDLRYSTELITLANWASATRVETVFFFPSAAGTEENLKVEKLNPNTTYYFGVRAMDKAGNLAALSNPAQGETKAAAAGELEVLWSLEFNEPGLDPTTSSDWRHRTPGQTTFDPATQVVDGVLKTLSFNPVIDSAPKVNFTDEFIAELRLKCLTQVAEETVYPGAVFWVNMDTVDGLHAAIAISLGLLEDGTQRLNIINNGTILKTYPGLSSDFQNVRLQYEPVFKQVRVNLNGVDMDVLPYERKAMNDDRYASVLSWGAEAEFDYVRIGRPARPMDARWDLSFSTPAVDPTAKGDWRHRTPGQTSFDPGSQVIDGVLKTLSFNPVLDSSPKDDFTYPFITEVQMRCLSVVADDAVYNGAVFWINMDTTNETHAAVTVSLQLMEDGTQRLNIINNGAVITSYPGLSTDFHTVRMEFEPAALKFRLFIDGSDAGVMDYVKKAANDDRYASILSWGAEGEFKYARIGTPVSAASPQLILTRAAAAGLVIEWPSSATGFNLESTPSLSSVTWTAVSEPPVVQGTQNRVTTSIGAGARYYRLKK